MYQCDFSSALDDHEVKIKVDNEEINVVDYMSRLEKEEEAMKSKVRTVCFSSFFLSFHGFSCTCIRYTVV